MAKQDYKSMMAELQLLLADMQSDEIDVDEVLAKYARGQTLIMNLQKYLEAAENTVKVHKSEQ